MGVQGQQYDIVKKNDGVQCFDTIQEKRENSLGHDMHHDALSTKLSKSLAQFVEE